MRRIIITMTMLLFALIAKAQLSTSTDCVQCGGTDTGRRGEYSSVLGYNNSASGANTISGGLGNSALGETSIALGNSNYTSGINSIALGQNDTVTGLRCIGIGLANKSSGTNAISIGYMNVSSGVNTMSIGVYTKSHSNSGIVIGKGYSYAEPLLNNKDGIMMGFGSNVSTLFISNSSGKNKTGKIAIGNTTTPQAKLHVLADSNENADLLLQGTGTSSNAVIMFQNANNKISVSSSGNMAMNASSFSLTGGNVGIGCVANSGYALSVDGGLLSTKVSIKEVGEWPDYVFSEEHELMSLEELEEYIENNSHLPSVPSRDEVLENGIDVAEMNAVLLEKIEELTLYVIELQKQIEKQQNEINELKTK